MFCRWLVDGEVSGIVGNSYTMTKVQRAQDQQLVTCEATNAVGSSTLTHALNVTCKHLSLFGSHLSFTIQCSSPAPHFHS